MHAATSLTTLLGFVLAGFKCEINILVPYFSIFPFFLVQGMDF